MAVHRPGRAIAIAQTIQERGSSAAGFTLIELLVVILIIGILAAIAIPSFLNQRSKANDAAAKELVRTAQTTAETLATDNGGSYLAVTASALNAIEPTIPIVSNSTSAYVTVSGTPSVGTYTVNAVAEPTGDTYTITRNANGTVSRTCTVTSLTDKGGCPLATTTGVSAAYTW